jgi:hypothetical protein
MSHFRLDFDRLRISIANKARVTTNEADAYLNLQPLSEVADRSFQTHYASFTTEERQFINDIHRFSSNETKLKDSRDPIIPAEQIKTQTEQNPSETISDISNCFYKSQSGKKAVWWISFDGSLPIFLSASVNFECIKMLLENRHKFIPNGELLAKKTKMGSDFPASNADVAEDYSSSGHDEDVASRKRGSGIDPSSVSLTELNKNKAAYETQLTSTDLSEKERAGIEEALATVTQCINRESEYRKNPIFRRERKNLEKTINRGIDEISKSCSKLGQHLKLFMKPVNGMGWSYSPDSNMNWDTHDR